MNAARKNLVGLEAVACIPGTVGGAVVMNAGSDEGTTSDLLVRVEVVTSAGRRRVFMKNELSFGYRHSLFQGAEWLILSADFRMRHGDGTMAAEAIEAKIEERMRRYPMEFANAGSVFKRPKGDYAGRLIELSGCKGLRVGDAMVSERHANFIVNLGNATAADILGLISEVQKRVFEKTNVLLEPEQIWLGD
ncbi:MAG: UDP-N-acetylenolpyruvoylglucosamine reductase [candidate division Zixibacteria bacterium 4484_95]|nr:MAG: UDP-N-acetylenolpyruvoylglucosamine reductase [candidate division Zixibacteria bacterium 4484_95]